MAGTCLGVIRHDVERLLCRTVSSIHAGEGLEQALDLGCAPSFGGACSKAMAVYCSSGFMLVQFLIQIAFLLWWRSFTLMVLPSRVESVCEPPLDQRMQPVVPPLLPTVSQQAQQLVGGKTKI